MILGSVTTALSAGTSRHKSAVMTLDQYGHLFTGRLDVVADAMDAARSSALADVSPQQPSAEVRALR
jgi:hypothetical protein